MAQRLCACHTLELRHSKIKPADFFPCTVANFYTRREWTLPGAYIFKVGYHHLSQHVPAPTSEGASAGLKAGWQPCRRAPSQAVGPAVCQSIPVWLRSRRTWCNRHFRSEDMIDTCGWNMWWLQQFCWTVTNRAGKAWFAASERIRPRPACAC